LRRFAIRRTRFGFRLGLRCCWGLVFCFGRGRFSTGLRHRGPGQFARALAHNHLALEVIHPHRDPLTPAENEPVGFKLKIPPAHHQGVGARLHLNLTPPLHAAERDLAPLELDFHLRVVDLHANHPLVGPQEEDGHHHQQHQRGHPPGQKQKPGERVDPAGKRPAPRMQGGLRKWGWWRRRGSTRHRRGGRGLICWAWWYRSGLGLGRRLELFLQGDKLPVHFRRVLRSLGRAFGQQAMDQADQLGRKPRCQLVQPRRLLLHHGRQHHGQCPAAEWPLPRKHVIKHRPQTEQVAAVVQFFAPGLFRSHVVGRADHRTGVCQVGILPHGPGQPEVQQPHPAVFLQPDVGRLDVAVNQPLVVGGCQRGGHLAGDAHGFKRRERFLALQVFVERLPPQQWHGDERHAAFLAHLVDGHDALVLHGGHGPSLAQETFLGPGVAGQRRLHHLQGHRTLQLKVFGQKHHAHAARANHPQHPVAAQPAHLAGLLRRDQQVELLGEPGSYRLDPGSVLGRQLGFGLVRGVGLFPGGHLLGPLDHFS